MTIVAFEIPLIVTAVYNDENHDVQATDRIAWIVANEIKWAGLADYSDGKVESYSTKVEDARLFITAQGAGTADEIVRYFDGQFSDGWGENFEQRPQKSLGRDLYISTWRQDWRAEHPATVK